jgi:hypothetical protein
VLAVRGEFAGVEDHVIAFAVAVGAGDTETAAGGLQDELELGELSETLGVEFALAGGGYLWAVWTGTLPRRVEQPFRAGVQFECMRLLPAKFCRDRLFRDKLFRDKLWARR